MNFADKLYNLRKEKQISQEDLAEKLDISRQSVSKWESGAAMPEIDKIIMLSEIFGVSTDYLLKESEPVQIVSSGFDNALKEAEAEKKAEIESLVSTVKHQTVVAYLGMLSAVGLFLLYYLSIIPRNQGILAAIIACICFEIMGFIRLSLADSKIKNLTPKTKLREIQKSSYVKTIKIIHSVLYVPAVTLLILTIFTKIGIIALFCFLFNLALSGFNIFRVLKPKKNII